ncbi:MAG TPA: hypothetical protein VLM75_00095 [Spirochaetota bacterium]|nr:hypothetical protein [Spirochaetota bacterium]
MLLKLEHISMLTTAFIVLAGFMSFSEAGDKPGRQSEFTGRVIDVGGSYVELKRGARELRLEYAATTRFFGLDGVETDKNVIELCQVVKAVYQPVNRAGEPASIAVVKEGNCRK